MRNAVIVSATRTAAGKAPNGALRTVRPDEMAAVVIKAALVMPNISTPLPASRGPSNFQRGLITTTPYPNDEKLTAE